MHRKDTYYQGILKGEVSLYPWHLVWLVWSQLYDNWQFLFYLQNRLIQISQTVDQQYSDTPPFSIPCILRTKLVSWLLSITFVGLDTKTLGLLQNPYITNL
jgi:hypothetical protein